MESYLFQQQEGWTPYDCAENRHNHEVAKLLEIRMTAIGSAPVSTNSNGSVASSGSSKYKVIKITYQEKQVHWLNFFVFLFLLE